MTPDRWQQISRMYYDALARDSGERASFLREACREDEALRQEVESLLAEPASAENFLAEPAVAMVPGLVDDPAEPALTGQTLGAYHILDLLGVGGMGQVYRARDTKLGRQVAIKVLPRLLSADRERVARFDREARLLASLNHPHIAAIYGFEQTGGVHALVLELVEGPTLAERLQRGPLPVKEALRIARQIADALEAAHERRIVHRDLKPQNIKVKPDGTVKVLDFGLAKAAGAAANDVDVSRTSAMPVDGTSEGIILGTTSYMSPEQSRGQAVDKRTDIWAFGCVLYEMLTGRPVFGGETISDILAAVLKQEPDWQALPTDTPPGVRSLLRRCLRKDPGDRLHDIADARIEIQEAIAEPAAITPAGPSALRQQPNRTPARGRRWMAIAAAAIVAVGASVWIVWQSRIDSSSAVRSALAGQVRLAVLPFENLSRQGGDEWLAGAFADSLTLGLRDADDLVIVNRESVVRVTGSMQAPDAAAIQRLSRALAIDYYVSGSYQRVGNDLRVVARLIDVNAGTITVQESLTDRFANLLQMEDDLAHRFAAALQKSPTSLTRVGTSSLVAYQTVAEANDLYLRGRWREAIERLRIAVQQDDRYPEAWALLGKSYARVLSASTLTSSESPADIRQEALRVSRRAVELEPRLYEAQLALALSYGAGEQIESWRLAAQKAIELNPRLPEAYSELGASYFATPSLGCARRRDPELAERLLRRGIELDPQAAPSRSRLIYHLTWAGREVDALREADEAVRRLPTEVNLLRARATALLWLGRPDDLERQLRDVVRIAPRSIQDEWEFAVVDLLRGQDRTAATQFALIVERPPQTLRAIDTARIYLQVGQTSTAIPYLNRAFSIDVSCATFVKESPAFGRYRTDPALAALLRKYSAARPR